MACTIGQTKDEIDKFFVRFEKTIKKYTKEIKKRKGAQNKK
jgi:hypothetical protein